MILENLWGTLGRCGIVLLALLTLDGDSANGQTFYNIFDPNVGERLVQLNADGTSSIVQVGNLPQAGGPVFSNDGRLLSVRSGVPNQFSTNIHVLDRINSNLQQITNFADSTDPLTGNTTNETPRFTAFSPDGSQLFVLSFLNVASNNQGGGTTIFARVYRVSDGVLVTGPIPIGITDSVNTTGTGADWSTFSNLIAIPAASATGNGAVAIIGENALANLPRQQLTFPDARTFGDIFNNTTFFDNDCFPSFSPDGRSLAYFRSRFLAFNGQAQPSPLSLRISDANGDRSVFDFNPGFFPTGLSWSADATQLVFGLGQQSFGGGTFPLSEQPGTSEIVRINVDGTGIQQLVPPLAFFPAVSPVLGPDSTNDLGDVNRDGNVDFLDITPFILVLSTSGFQAEADINGDGLVNFLDIAPFIAILAAT